MPDPDVPSEVLLDSTLGAPLVDELEQLDHRRLRALVHERVFGESPEATRVGRYILLERLGAGGMGVVFSAYDQELDRKVAIKLLHQDRGLAHRSRLLREAQALARLSHPNVVAVHDVGETGGKVFVAMEFVAGRTLREWTRERSRSVAEIIEVYMQAGRGLEAAHAAGIVHGDFKPDNVLIGDDGRVRVLDFGLARASADEVASDAEGEPATSRTRTGSLMGTPTYMAPEQYLERTADARSDQFAFCVSLHESLYRTRPFAGDNFTELARNVIAGDLREIEAPASPRWLRDLIRKGLAPEPEQRFADMTELLRELARDRVTGRRRAALAVSIVALTGLTAVYLSSREQAHEREAEALSNSLVSEGRRADDAERELRRREDAVTIAEAALLVPDSPIDALARLRDLHDDHEQAGAAWIIASDARQRGFPRELSRWPAHLALIRASHDGRRVLLSDGDPRTLYVFDAANNRTIATELVVEEGPPIGMSANGRFVVVPAADASGLVELRDVDAGVTTRIARPARGTIDGLGVSPDGQQIVMFMAEEGARPWVFDRTGAGRELPADTSFVEFVPNSDALLLGERGGSLRRFDPSSCAPELLARNVGGLVVSPDGAYAAATTRGWDNPRVSIIDLDDGRELANIEFEDGPALNIEWSPDSAAVVVADWQGGAFVAWLDGRRLELPPHDGRLRRFAFSPDAKRLASGSVGGSVSVIGLGDGVVEALPGHRSLVALAFDERGELRTIDEEGTLRVWDSAPRQRTLANVAGHELAWSRKDALALASLSQLVVVSATTGEQRWTSSEHAPYERLAWSDAGDRLVTTHGDGYLRVWTDAGELVRTIPSERGEFGGLRWLGDRVAWGETDVGVQLVDPDSGAHEQIELASAASVVAIEPEGDRLWVGINHERKFGSIVAFAQDGWAQVAEHELDSGVLADFAPIPNRDQLVYANTFGDVFVLDTQTGERRLFGEHDGRVQGLEVDSSGRTLYTGSEDGSARIWDLASGRWRALRVDGERLWSFARSPDGRRLVTAHDGGALRIWADDLPYAWPELAAWIDEASPASL